MGLFNEIDVRGSDNDDKAFVADKLELVDARGHVAIGFKRHRTDLANRDKNADPIAFPHCGKKTKLTENHMAARLQYAHDYIHWTAEDWRHVVAVDEKVFSTAKNGRRGVWRLPRTRYERKNILPKYRSGCFASLRSLGDYSAPMLQPHLDCIHTAYSP
ncbi:hypothetical protein TKK_0005959 [Trichogramma kaykai]